jgi:hypothetical protein
MSKMSSHDPFGHLKHKLWPKEGLQVKLAIWLLTIKSQESTWFLCMQVTWNIPLKSSQRGLQLCFRPHLNRRSAHKVRGPQLGNLRTKCHLDVCLMERHRIYYKGEGGGFPKSGPWWVLLIWVCLWLVLTPKMLKLCTN